MSDPSFRVTASELKGLAETMGAELALEVFVIALLFLSFLSCLGLSLSFFLLFLSFVAGVLGAAGVPEDESVLRAAAAVLETPGVFGGSDEGTVVTLLGTRVMVGASDTAIAAVVDAADTLGAAVAGAADTHRVAWPGVIEVAAALRASVKPASEKLKLGTVGALCFTVVAEGLGPEAANLNTSVLPVFCV